MAGGGLERRANERPVRRRFGREATPQRALADPEIVRRRGQVRDARGGSGEQVLPDLVGGPQSHGHPIEGALGLGAKHRVQRGVLVHLRAVEQGAIEGQRGPWLTESLDAPEDARVFPMVRGPRVLEPDGSRDTRRAEGPDESKEAGRDELDMHSVRALRRASELVLQRRDGPGLTQDDARVVDEESLELRAETEGLAERRRVHDEMRDEIERRLGGLLRDVQAQGLVAREIERTFLQRGELAQFEAIVDLFEPSRVDARSGQKGLPRRTGALHGLREGPHEDGRDPHDQGHFAQRVKPAGPEVSVQQLPAGQSVSQKHRARHAPFTHVDCAGQLSVKMVVVQAPPPSEPLLKTQRPVGVVFCEVSTSHCWSGLQPVLRTGLQTATVGAHPPALPASPSGRGGEATSGEASSLSGRGHRERVDRRDRGVVGPVVGKSGLRPGIRRGRDVRVGIRRGSAEAACGEGEHRQQARGPSHGVTVR